jgi:hypothetical protein
VQRQKPYVTSHTQRKVFETFTSTSDLVYFEHHNSKYSRRIIEEMKSKMMIRTGHVGYMEGIVNVHSALNQKSQRNGGIWRPRYKWVDNSKV